MGDLRHGVGPAHSGIVKPADSHHHRNSGGDSGTLEPDRRLEPAPEKHHTPPTISTRPRSRIKNIRNDAIGQEDR